MSTQKTRLLLNLCYSFQICNYKPTYLLYCMYLRNLNFILAFRSIIKWHNFKFSGSRQRGIAYFHNSWTNISVSFFHIWNTVRIGLRLCWKWISSFRVLFRSCRFHTLVVKIIINSNCLLFWMKDVY